MRRHVALPHTGENRGVEPLHRKLDQGDIAEETRIEHARGDALPCSEQADAALPHADNGIGAVGKPIGEEAAEWGRSVPLLDAGGKFVLVREGTRGEDVLGRAIEVERPARLHDSAGAHQSDAVAHAHRERQTAHP